MTQREQSQKDLNRKAWERRRDWHIRHEVERARNHYFKLLRRWSDAQSKG